jgi:cell wall-associated NlpC family hydrolase
MRWLFLNDEIWNKVKEELLSWLNTPYKHMCGVKSRGVDCNQFVAVALTNAGVMDGFEYDYYSTDWFLHLDNELILDYVRRNKIFLKENIDLVELPPTEEVMRGDYLGFSYNSPKGLVNHVGVMLDDNTFIHSCIGRGVCLSEFNDFWKRHLKIIIRAIEVV